MNMTDQGVTIAVRADTAPFSRALQDLEQLSQDFGASLSGALRDAAVSGRALNDVLRNLAQDLAGRALAMGLAPLESLTSSLFGRLSGVLAGAVPFARGGVLANGGIIAQPTLFPMRGNTGLMGEAGPEAILPLSRGADGRLGVAGGQGGQPVHITFHVQAPEPAAFAKSQAQISAMLARTVSRGFQRF